VVGHLGAQALPLQTRVTVAAATATASAWRGLWCLEAAGGWLAVRVLDAGISSS
jgi:hypothetical protein